MLCYIQFRADSPGAWLFKLVNTLPKQGKKMFMSVILYMGHTITLSPGFRNLVTSVGCMFNWIENRGEINIHSYDNTNTVVGFTI